MVYVPTCLRACVVYVPTCQKRTNFLFLRVRVPKNVPTCQKACQRAKKRANFANIPLMKGNFYTLSLYKKLYFILDIILIHIMCICIAHINCIILYFLKLFSSLVRNGNIKRSGFYTLQVTRAFSNFPQLKQLNKIKNICEYCGLLEL